MTNERESRIIVGLDIGTSKVVAMVGVTQVEETKSSARSCRACGPPQPDSGRPGDLRTGRGDPPAFPRRPFASALASARARSSAFFALIAAIRSPSGTSRRPAGFAV